MRKVKLSKKGNQKKWSALLAVACLLHGATTYASHNDTAYALPEIMVTDSRENIYPGGMVERQVRLGALGNVDFMNMPTSSLAFGEKVLEQGGEPARAFFDAATRHPAVLVGGCSTDNNVELQIRGHRFNTYDILVDGVPGLMPMGSNTLNWVERMEITPGGNVPLQGLGVMRSLTGTINIVPKRAAESDFFQLKESVSGQNIYTHTVDWSMRHGEKREWGIRINGMYGDGKTGIEREQIKQENIVAHIDYRTEKSNSSVLYGWEKTKHLGMPEVLMLGAEWGKGVTKLPDPNKVIDNFMPDWSELSRSRKMLLLQHEQRVNGKMVVFAKGGFQTIDYPGYLDSKPKLLDDAGSYELSISGNGTQSLQSRHALSLGVRGEETLGAIRHLYTVGYDRLGVISEWSNGSNGTKSSLKNGNIYNAVPLSSYKRPVVAPANYYVGTDNTAESWYLVDFISDAKDKWNVVFGARHQRLATRTETRSRTLPTISVMYKPSQKMSVYGSYGASMDVMTAPKDAANAYEALKPYEVKQYEIGIKHDSGKIATTLAFFDTRKPQGIYTNEMKDGKNFFRMDGEARYRGVEFNIFGKLAENLNIQGGFVSMTGEQKQMTNPALNGKLPQGLAKFNATLALEWLTPVEGLSVDGRILYVGKTYADGLNRIRVPGWTRFDVGVKYEKEYGGHKYQLRGMVYNVANKRYWSSTVVNWGDGGVMYNPGRTGMISLSVDF